MSIQILNGLITLKLALTESDRMTYTPEEGEPVWSVEAKTLYMGDGSTVGGVRLTGDIEDIEYLLGQLDQRLNQEVSDREDADEDLQDLIDQINNTLGQLSAVAFSGSYNDLSDTPDIPVLSVAGKIGHVELVKADVGLGNVDNTSDLNKPISTATQNALDTKANSDDLADIATSGSFNDLEDVPSLVNTVAGRNGDVVLNKSDVGLGNVDNTSDLNKPISTATQGALDLKANEADLADVATSGSFNDLEDVPSLVNSVAGRTGAVTLTKSDVGLSNVDNTPDLNKPISIDTQNALDLKANAADLADVATSGSYNDLSDTPTIDYPVTSVAGKTGAVTLVKGDVGLGNVDNTSDLNKPISTATQGALDLKANAADLAEVAFSGDFTDLENIPSLVNTVAGKSGDVALDKYDIGLNDIDNTSDLNKPISTATQNALNLKANTADLATVATSGSYDDLTDKPIIENGVQEVSQGVGIDVDNTDITKPIVALDAGSIDSLSKADSAVQPADLADVATSGSYNDLSDTPTIVYPVTSVAGKTGDVLLAKSDVGLGNVDNTSDLSKPISTATQNALNAKANTSSLSDIAFSGDYNDLLNVPTTAFPVTSVAGRAGDVVLTKADVGLGNVDNTSDLNKPISTATQGALDLKANEADLATVATSGSYNDLADKPTIAGQANADWNATSGVEEILNKPTTVEGYGITNALTDDDVGVSVASLVAGKIPSSQIPAIAITEPHVVDSEVEQLALVVQVGDIAIRTDLSTTFINATGSNGSMSDWTELLSPPNAVQSVNGQTGAVVLGKSDVGLGNVDNTSDLNKPISTATQNALNAKANTASLSDVAFSGSFVDLDDVPSLVNSVAGRTGVVTLTKADVGLGNVNNTSDLNKPISTATQGALDLKADITYVDSGLSSKANTADLADVATSGSYNDLSDKPTIPNVPVQSVAGRTGDVVLTKADVGLNDVDNTSDLNKPISTATQNALNAKQNAYGTQAPNHVLAGPTSGANALPTFRALTVGDIPSLSSTYVVVGRQVTAGGGLTGGGTLSSNISISLGTPSTLTPSTTNSSTGDTHTHVITGFLPTAGGTITGNLVVEGYAQARMRSVSHSSGSVSVNALNGISEKTSTSNVQATIPNNFGSNMDTITFVNNAASGDFTLVAGSGNQLMQAGEAVADIVIAPYSTITLIRLSSNRWVTA